MQLQEKGLYLLKGVFALCDLGLELKERIWVWKYRKVDLRERMIVSF